MSTELKILTNRQNAQKSTGPRTAEGKAAVSRNAVKHGLSSARDVITSESQAEFDSHSQNILSELSPATPIETMLADRIVTLSWRLKRISRFQNQTIDALHEDNTSNPLKKLTRSLLKSAMRDFAISESLPQPEHFVPSKNLTLGRLAVKDFSSARVLERLLMYERRLENSLYRTILEFQRLQLTRKFNTQL